jgi:hypothetical protein
MRPFQTTYYGPGRGKKKPIVKITYGSNRHEILPNIMRRLTQNLDGAVVVETIDVEYGELLLVVTMFPGEAIRVAFKKATHPVLVTHELE